MSEDYSGTRHQAAVDEPGDAVRLHLVVRDAGAMARRWLGEEDI